MTSEQGPRLPGGYGAPELDELQRSSEPPASVETLERVVPPTHGESREVPVPQPADRTGAIPPEALEQPDEAGGETSIAREAA